MKRSERNHYLKIFLLGAVLSLAWGGISYLLHPDRVFSVRPLEDLFAVSLPAQVVLYGFAGPVMEEVLFRGILYTLLRKALPEMASAFIASALFGLWHGNVIQFLYAFPMGLLFQYLMNKDHSILSPVCCHVGANLAAVAVHAVSG